jgi:Lar family restriction alleviation protein
VSAELLHCPFCGFDGVSPLKMANGYAVFCGGCEVEGPMKSTEQEAMAAWNRRTVSAPAADAGDVLEIPSGSKTPSEQRWYARGYYSGRMKGREEGAAHAASGAGGQHE